MKRDVPVVRRGDGEFVIGGNPFDGQPAVRLDDEEYAHARAAGVWACYDLVVVNPDGKVLLGLRRHPPVQDWCVIGGRRAAGESRADAAARIAREEMGFELDPSSRRLVLIGLYEYVLGEVGMRHDETSSWLCRVTREEARTIRLNPSHFDDQRWVMPHEVLAPNGGYHPIVVETIGDYFAKHDYLV